MPKIRKPSELIIREARDALMREILLSRTAQGIQQHDIATEMRLSDSTVSALFKDPDKLTPPRIRVLARMGLISPATVLSWLGFSEGQIRAKEGCEDKK